MNIVPAGQSGNAILSLPIGDGEDAGTGSRNWFMHGILG